MTILKRYVFWRFVQVNLLTTSGLIGIFLIIDFFERADEFIMNKSPMIEWLSYYIYKVPFVFSYMAPQAVLLATVITLTSFSKNSEFIAMKACGIGVTGITTPILVGSLIISMIILCSNEFLMPSFSKKMNYIFKIRVQGRSEASHIKRDNLWFKSRDGSIWNVNYYDPDRSMMRKVSIFFSDGHHQVKRRVDAAAVIWNGQAWEFMDGYIRTFSHQGLTKTEYFKKRIFLVYETPADFVKSRRRPEEMSVRELYMEIQSETGEGVDTTKKWVDLHKKISYPFVSVVLALIGIPLSLRTNRSGGFLFCVGVSLAVGLAFSFFYAMGISLGRGGTFSPILATWGPLLIFACGGFYLLLTMDSEKILPI